VFEHGVDVIYYASYIDDEGMDMLEAKKTKHIVAPGINWLIATCKFLWTHIHQNRHPNDQIVHDAAAFGYPHEKAEQVGYQKKN
jgi:hypothetical protein